MISMHADNSAYICTMYMYNRVALKHTIRICTKPKVFDFHVSKPDDDRFKQNSQIFSPFQLA